MKRYIVTNRTSNVTHGLFESLGEALADAIKLQDQGKKVSIIDSQGSGLITVGHYDILEAEGYIGHYLGSETIQHPTPIADILEMAKKHKPDNHVYHWDIGHS